MPITSNWITTSGVWTTASNWSTNAVPTSTVAVTITSQPNVLDSISGQGTSASLTASGQVQLLGSFTTSATALTGYGSTLSIGSAGSLNDSGGFSADFASNLTVAGGSVSITGSLIATNVTETLNGGSITVGNLQANPLYNNSSNNYVVTAGVYRVLGNIKRGSASANDTFNVSGNNSSINGGQFLVSGSVDLGSDTVNAFKGGIIQFGTVNTLTGGSDTFSVDASSSIEIGTGNGPVAGAFTVDSDQIFKDGGAISAPTIIDNGTIEVSSGLALALNGTGTGLLGTGLIKIDANSFLGLEAVSKQSQNTIVFNGAGGTLSIANSSLNASQAFVPVISGFGSTDRIVYQGLVTSTSFSGNTLTLFNGASIVATLTIQGSYGGQTFFANYQNGQTQISVSTGGDTATPPAGTTTSDQYVWTPNIAGSWDSPANWIDTTAGSSPASVAPGVHDLVTIASGSPSVIDVVTGTGNAASLTLGGNVDLKGQFTTASLSLQNNATVDGGAVLTDTGDLNSAAQTQLVVSGGSLAVTGNVIENYQDAQTLNAGSIKVGGIKLVANGGAYEYNSYTVTGGTYEVTGSYASGADIVSVSGAGHFKVDGNTALLSDSFYASGTGSIQLTSVTAGAANADYFNVADSATIEIGAAGGTAAGSFTIDAGKTLTDGGYISTAGNIVINGTLAVGDGETMALNGGVYNQTLNQYSGGLTGTGTIKIGNNAELDINQGVASGAADTISFTGTGGVLAISPYSLTSAGAFIPSIIGFGPSDRIEYQGTVTNTVYNNGVLTLLNGTTTVATLKVALATGTTNPVFFSNTQNGQTQISVSTGGDTATPPAGTTSPDLYSWNALKGSWDSPANWIDTTTGSSPASVAPGVHDLVTIASGSPSVIDVVTGTGNAASLTLGGNVDLKGQFTTASLSLQNNATVDGGAVLTDTGDLNSAAQTQLVVSGGSLAVTGNVIENYQDAQTLNAGSIKVGGIKLVANGGAYEYNSYTVTGGTYEVTGSYASGADIVSVSGAGHFKVDGNTALLSDSFYASGTGSIQLTSVTAGAANADYFNVADSATIEIGAAGGTAAGSFTIDAGKTLTDGGYISAAGNIVINGTLAVGDGETMALNGGVYNQTLNQYSGGLTGTGTIKIGNNAELDINQGVASGAADTISFTGTGGVLAISPYSLTSAGAFIPSIIGFGPSDRIEYQGTVTNTVYNNGVLTLLNGTTTVATLKVALATGTTNPVFFSNIQNGQTQISVSTGGDTATPPAGTTTSDQYVWTPNIAGSWDSPANWIDTTTGSSPASVAPGVHDLVTIASGSPSVIDVVTGTGNAASLTLGGNVDLKGQFTTASLSLQNNATVDGGAVLTDTGDLNSAAQTQLVVSGGSLAVTGNVIENYQDAQTLNAGSIKVGGIKLVANGGAYEYNSYTVMGGTYEVTGSYASGADIVSVSGAGHFKVDGNTALLSDSFYASGTGSIQLTSVTAGAANADYFNVADSATIEIGAAGGTAAGSFTIDAGKTLTDGGYISAAGNIVINGTLAVGDGETMALNGGVYNQTLNQYSGGLTGTGTIKIGNNAELDINQGVASGAADTISFTGTGGVLAISPYSLTSAGAFIPSIIGFGPSDRIEYQGTVTNTVYNNGVLTLLNGTTTVATLKVALATGTTNPVFFSNIQNGQTQISVSTGGDTATPPAGTTTSDQYVWTPNIAGSWDSPANWIDTTTGSSPASVAPGVHDLVTIASGSPSVIDVVTGTGNAASLTLGGNVDLKGQFTTASLSLQNNATVDGGAVLTDTGDLNSAAQTQLVVSGGSLAVTGNVIENYQDAQTLNAGSIKVGGIKLVANGGAYEHNSYTVMGGTYEVTGSYASGADIVSVSGAGHFKVDGNTALLSDSFYASGTGSIQLTSVTAGAANADYFNVADSATIEIGAAGGTAAGSFTIDAGKTLTDGGYISTAGNIVINGTLAVGDGETMALNGGVYNQTLNQYSGGLTGTGTIKIGNNAELDINQGVASGAADTISFTGTGGVLAISPYSLTSAGAFIPSIIGFGPSDRIEYQGTVTNTVYNNGVLTLLNGTAIVGNLKVALNSSYANPSFQTTSSSNLSQISLLTTGSHMAPSLTFSSVSFASTGQSGANITNNPSTTFSGTVSDSAGISSVELYSGSTDLGSATLSGTQWTLTTNLADGVYSNFYAIATDSTNSTTLASNSTGFTVDTAAPVVTLALANDTGASSTDNITSDPTLSGNGDPGANVTFIIDGKAASTTATANSAGAWSFTPSGLADGTHTIMASETDSAGNTGSATLTFKLQTVQAAAPALAAGSDTGSSATDGITNDKTPTLTGKTGANAAVTLYDGTSIVGTGVADASGTYSITSSTLAEGSHSFTITTTDAEGNVSSHSTAKTVVIDTTAPAVPSAPTLAAASDSGSSSTDGITKVTTPTVTGTAAAGSTVTLYDGTTKVGSAVANSSGAYSIVSSALANGSHTLTVTATDPAGNASAASPGTVVVIDTTAPVAPAAPTLDAASNSGSTSDNITNDPTPTFTGTAEAGSTVTLLDGTTKVGTAVAGSNGAYSITSSALASKSHSLTVTATDAAGNVSTASPAVVVVVDTAAPAKPAAPALAAGSDTGSSATDGITDKATPTVTGKAEANATVTLYDGTSIVGTGIANASGVYSITSTSLADGSHSLTVTATDAAGNVSVASPAKTVVIDTAAPATPPAPTLATASDSGSSSTDGITKVTKPTVTGTAVAGSTVTLYDGTTKIGSAVATSSGTYSIVSTATLASGSHSLTVTATDTAGNVSGTSPPKVVVIDTTAPATPAAPVLTAASDSGSSNSDDITNVTTPTFTGTAEAGSTVTLLDGTTKVGTAIAGSNGAYSITSSALASKSHSLTVTATDAAGNVSAASPVLTVVVDTKAPSAPGALSLAAGSDTGSSATDGITSDPTPTVTGTAEANASVTLFDGTTAVGTGVASSSGAYSITTSTLAEGSHSLTAKATDAAGNVSVASAAKTVVIDTTAPAVAITSAGGTVTTASQTIAGSGEVGSTVTLTDNGAAIGKALTVGSGGTWSEAITLSSGSNAIVATGADKAGNTGTSNSVTYTFGTTPAAAHSASSAASMNSLVQAMATMTAAPSSTMTPTPPPPPAPEASLAPAH